MKRILWILIVLFSCEFAFIKSDETSLIGLVTSETNQSTTSLMNKSLFLMIKDENNHHHLHLTQLKIDHHSFPFSFNLSNIQDIQISGNYFFSLLIFGVAHRLLWQSFIFRRHLVANSLNRLSFVVKDVSDSAQCLLAGYPCLNTLDMFHPSISACCNQMRCESSKANFSTCNGGAPVIEVLIVTYTIPVGIIPVIGPVDRYFVEVTEKIIQAKFEPGAIIKVNSASFIIDSNRKSQLELHLTLITSALCNSCLIKSKQFIQEQSIPFQVRLRDGSSMILVLQHPVVTVLNPLSTVTEHSSSTSTTQLTTEMSSTIPNQSTMTSASSSSSSSPITTAATTSQMRRGTWVLTTNMTYSRMLHTASVLSNGLIIITGGHGPENESVSDSTELYDPSLNVWTSGANMTFPRIFHTASVLSNGLVLVTGGSLSLLFPIGHEFYNLSSNTWSLIEFMSVSGMFNTASVLSNGSVLITGDVNFLTNKHTSELYHPLTNNWTMAAPTNYPRLYRTATVLLNGFVLVAGGFDEITKRSLPTAELYDPSSDTWTLTGNMSVARAFHTVTQLLNGSVLVVGGAISNKSYTNSAELYDTLSESWKFVGNMTYPRTHHTATLLQNGFVLVAGGGEAEITNTAEVYDPSSDTWLLVENMTYPRAFHTASLLRNGSVLITGGTDGNIHLNTAEIFHF